MESDSALCGSSLLKGWGLKGSGFFMVVFASQSSVFADNSSLAWGHLLGGSWGHKPQIQEL